MQVTARNIMEPLSFVTSLCIFVVHVFSFLDLVLPWIYPFYPRLKFPCIFRLRFGLLPCLCVFFNIFCMTSLGMFLSFLYLPTLWNYVFAPCIKLTLHFHPTPLSLFCYTASIYKCAAFQQLLKLMW